MTEMKTGKLRIVNRPVSKVDAHALVTGKAVYTNDLAPSDCLIVKVLRSPHAHALIKEINTARAEAVPGIECILTYKDCPDKRFTMAGQTYPEPSPYDRLILDQRVRFVGDAAAIIAALILRELPRHIGLGSRRVMPQGKTPAVLKQDGFLDFIALYVLQCLKPPFRPRANVARSSLMLRNKGAGRGREYSIIPTPAAPSKKPGISSLPGRQIVTAARPFLPHFPHTFPAFTAVSFGLAGVGTVGLTAFG